MNILGFLYGLREAEMKSCLWQAEAPDTALSSQAWHDELLRLLSEPGGFAWCCCCCCRGLWGSKSLQIPLLGFLKSPWPSSSCPELQLLAKGLVQHLGPAGWTRARGKLTGAQWCSHTPAPQQGLRALSRQVQHLPTSSRQRGRQPAPHKR